MLGFTLFQPNLHWNIRNLAKLNLATYFCPDLLDIMELLI